MSPEVSPLVAGCASAGLTTLLLQPLDLVKTRLQEDRGARVATEVRAIVAEGGVRALWTGVTPSLWGELGEQGAGHTFRPTLQEREEGMVVVQYCVVRNR